MTILQAAAMAALMASAVHADNLSYPEPLADALAMTYETPEDAHWRFVVDITAADQTLSARFDGSRPDGEDWTLISPTDPATLNDELSEIWVDMNTPNEAEPAEGDSSIGRGGLFFDAESALMVDGEVRPLGSGRYAFAPNLDPGSDEDDLMQEHLSGELSLADAGHVGEIRIFAPESFKPNAAARIHTFEMVMTFDRQDGLPAPIMTSLSTHVEVSALFQRHQQRMAMRFSDVEYVEP
ncbi:hypothetical protein [Hyphobacterium sp.]|uniref:hypothetical protein n=1 Tax=Hyphobacterium sp. TaxID=2004662 RepID=UPI003B52D4E8